MVKRKWAEKKQSWRKKHLIKLNCSWLIFLIYLHSWEKILGFELGYTVFHGADVKGEIWILKWHFSVLKHDESGRSAMSFSWLFWYMPKNVHLDLLGLDLLCYWNAPEIR